MSPIATSILLNIHCLQHDDEATRMSLRLPDTVTTAYESKFAKLFDSRPHASHFEHYVCMYPPTSPCYINSDEGISCL
jgi:hypothetical protein